MIKVITYGTYDLLHYGHIKLLQRAKELGDYLIVGVTSDDYDMSRGKINNQQSLIERIDAIKSLGIADEIIVEEYEGQKIDDIRRLDIDIFTVGSDWKGHFDYLSEYCKVVYLPRTEGISSTDIRSNISKLCFGTIGEKALCNKFINEMSYVNGVEYQPDFSLSDAVYICSHPTKHYIDVKNALLSGKHVICESPIALSVDQHQELLELAKKNELVLTDSIKTAYATAYSRLLLIAKSGRIGDIISVDAVCTSLVDEAFLPSADLSKKQNSICAWGPTALLPIFQLLGTDYLSCSIVSKMLDKGSSFDGFTKVDFVYPNSVASIKVAKAAKAEGDLVITGSKGYIYVPSPWWKPEYFEVRFENPTENRRHFYQLEGEGIRYEIVAFSKEILNRGSNLYIDSQISTAIIKVIEQFYNNDIKLI